MFMSLQVNMCLLLDWDPSESVWNQRFITFDLTNKQPVVLFRQRKHL